MLYYGIMLIMMMNMMIVVRYDGRGQIRTAGPAQLETPSNLSSTPLSARNEQRLQEMAHMNAYLNGYNMYVCMYA